MSTPSRTPGATERQDNFSVARDQLQRLRADGGTYRAIAAAAGLSPPPSMAWPPAAPSRHRTPPAPCPR
jgi:hypothetical protein